MAAQLLPLGFQPLDGNGKPRPGFKLYFYDEGTTNAVTVYSDSALSSAITQPVTADANGVAPMVYGNPGGYKIKGDTAADVQFLLQDTYAPPLPSDGGTIAVANGGTGAANATDARSNIGAASASDVTTLSTDVADVKGQVDALPGGALGAVAALSSVSYTDLSDIDRIVLQRVLVTDASQTGLTSASFPYDNTIPQITEGKEVFSQSFTPVDAQSIIEIRALVNIGTSSNYNGGLAIFRSDSTSAIATVPWTVASGTTFPVYAVARFSPSDTTARTFSVRIGANSSVTLTVNGSVFGSSCVSWMEILEYQDAPIT